MIKANEQHEFKHTNTDVFKYLYSQLNIQTYCMFDIFSTNNKEIAESVIESDHFGEALLIS